MQLLATLKQIKLHFRAIKLTIELQVASAAHEHPVALLLGGRQRSTPRNDWHTQDMATKIKGDSGPRFLFEGMGKTCVLQLPMRTEKEAGPDEKAFQAP